MTQTFILNNIVSPFFTNQTGVQRLALTEVTFYGNINWKIEKGSDLYETIVYFPFG